MIIDDDDVDDDDDDDEPLQISNILTNPHFWDSCPNPTIEILCFLTCCKPPSRRALLCQNQLDPFSNSNTFQPNIKKQKLSYGLGSFGGQRQFVFLSTGL